MTTQELVSIVSTRADAATLYFEEVRKELKPMVDSLCDAAKHDHLPSRVFLKIKLEEKDKDTSIAYRHLDFSSEVGRGFLTANGGEAGEFRCSISYQYANKAPKNITWYFPKEGAAAPKSLAEFIVQALVAPDDKQFE